MTVTAPLHFAGYNLPKDRPNDAAFQSVQPGTPGGEYLRRFWHPFLLSEQLDHRPKVVRVLSEDLVVYRDLSGGLGLVHKHCAHRGASLEFGIVAEKGIRCCYHGWLFSNDGALLETPGEPPDSPLRKRVCQGAYPVIEIDGVIFAYLGPPDRRPPFPTMDAMVMPGNRMKPYLIASPCNWIQVAENSMDPFHVAFLHTRISGPQFSEVFGTLPLIDYHETPNGFFYTNARRVGDYIWVRSHDYLLPNFSQNGAIFENVERVRYFGRPGLTRWVTPVDDTHTLVIAWRHFNDRDDPSGLGRPEDVGVGKTDFYGQSDAAPYEQRQDSPGDWEAWVSQGPMTSHAREHLATTDKGVALLRRKLRRAIDALANGVEPLQAKPEATGAVATMAGDTILRIPLDPKQDDREVILHVCRAVAAALMETRHLPDGERRAAMQDRLSGLNTADASEINPDHGKIFEFKTLG
ncbi:MAG: aromatic ring-hydroxylating dioxygenase subunit alpha [Rhodoferax sp.]|nr:aromatic ring-hydroxylating dioxygenase subunit alpha [Rhodoferax sp.]